MVTTKTFSFSRPAADFRAMAQRTMKITESFREEDRSTTKKVLLIMGHDLHIMVRSYMKRSLKGWCQWWITHAIIMKRKVLMEHQILRSLLILYFQAFQERVLLRGTGPLSTMQINWKVSKASYRFLKVPKFRPTRSGLRSPNTANQEICIDIEEK